MEYLIAKNRRYWIAANSRGSYKCKFNRAAKLACRYDELYKKFTWMAEKGETSQTETHRLAVATLLMMQTGVRVGNEGSAEGYMTKPHPYSKKEPEFVQTYGLTTLENSHVTVKPRKLHLNFVGKKQVENSFVVTDKNLIKWIKALAKNNDKLLFNITAYQLTKFIKKYVGKQFSPKDFRCMVANMTAYEYIEENVEDFSTKKQLNTFYKNLFIHVSEKLCNTPGVCKKSYVSPGLYDFLIENYMNTKK